MSLRRSGETPRGLLVNVPLVISLAVTLGGGWFATWSKGEAARNELATQLAEVKARDQALPEFQSSVLRELDGINHRLDRVEDRLK